MSRTKAAELALRGVVARLGGFLSGRPRPRPALLDGIRTVLVVRIDERVGNVLLTTPLLERLRDALPWARIDLLTAGSKRALIEGQAEVVPFEKKDFFKRPWRFFKLMWVLRSRRYDVAIDASHWHTFSTTSALLLAWTGAPIRICHARGEAARYATDPVDNPNDGEEGEVQTKLRLLRPLSIAPGAPELQTGLGAEGPGMARMRAWLAENGLSDAVLVGLIPGSRKHDHRLPAAFFAGLGQEARACGATPLVLWGPGEEALAEQVASGCDGVVAPPSDIEELAALMRLCRVVASNDTGPMHLSVATGTPTIGVFAQPEHWRWGHRYGEHAVVPGHDRPTEAVLDEARCALRVRLSGGAHEP